MFLPRAWSLKIYVQCIDDQWKELRGMEIQSVGIAAFYDETSQELINMRNKGCYDGRSV